MTHFPIEQFAHRSTPFYYYDVDLLRRTLDAIEVAQPQSSVVHYALKANSNEVLLRMIAERGWGADCVSGGELLRAVECGFSPDKIVFAGVGKSDAEICTAIELGIGCFNVESVAELEVIDTIAATYGKKVAVALRVNPHVDAHTHRYITTGMSENKFGIDISQIEQVVQKAQSLEHVSIIGLHFHIGSQIRDMKPYEELCVVINQLQDRLVSLGISLQHINVGGGLGVEYENPDEALIPAFDNYFDTFARHLLLREGQMLHFELGRSVVCQCGSLITRVLYIKEGLTKNFVIVDAGMTDLLRPALYQASHKVENITSQMPECTYDVVGPICESSDIFATDILLPQTRRGDLLAIRSAGAYGESMASQYNMRALPGSVIGE